MHKLFNIRQIGLRLAMHYMVGPSDPLTNRQEKTLQVAEIKKNSLPNHMIIRMLRKLSSIVISGGTSTAMHRMQQHINRTIQ